MSGTEFALWLKENIVKKLTQLNVCIDDELPDYIMIMVANNKESDCMKEDLEIFLADKTNEFVDWLHSVLRPSSTGNGTQETNDEQSFLSIGQEGGDDSMEEEFLVNPVEVDFDEEAEFKGGDFNANGFKTNNTNNVESMQTEPFIEVAQKSVSLSVNISRHQQPLPTFDPPEVRRKVIRLVNDHGRVIRKSLPEEQQRPLSVRNDNLEQSAKQIYVRRSVEPTVLRGVKTIKMKRSYQERKKELGLKPQATGNILFRAMADASGSAENKAAIHASLKRSNSETDRKVVRLKFKKNNNETDSTDLRLILLRKQLLRKEQDFKSVRSKIVIPDGKKVETPIMKMKSAITKLRLEVANEQMDQLEKQKQEEQKMVKDNGQQQQQPLKEQLQRNQVKPTNPASPLPSRNLSETSIQSTIEKMSCRFWPYCTNPRCTFHHPLCGCKYFPYCKLGDKCMFGHPPCRYDALCIKADCPFSHFSRSSKVSSTVFSANATSSSASKLNFSSVSNVTSTSNSSTLRSSYATKYVAPNLFKKSKVHRA